MISGTRYQLSLETNRQMRLAGEIARAQAEISSGKKILAPSDNPAAAARISDISRSQADQATWRANLDKAATLSAQADSVFKSLTAAFTRAAELMVAGRNQVLGTSDRETIAIELYSIAEHVASLRDTRDSRGELLFPTDSGTGIPVAADLEIIPVNPRSVVFDNVRTDYGVYDLETILIEAGHAGRNGRTGPTYALLDRVNSGIAHITAAYGEHGARANRIDDLIEQSESLEIITAEERKTLESADIAEVVARLQAKELSLEAAQAVFGRINRSNLFDLLA